MKRTLVRASAVALAVVGLSMAPAAAAPTSHELPGSPTPAISAPGGSQVVTPNASFCQVVGWWLWCRI